VINLACQLEKKAGLLHQLVMALSILGRELAQAVSNQIFPRRQRKLAIRLQLEGDPLRLVGSSVKKACAAERNRKVA
jgi:hypothetical protein